VEFHTKKKKLGLDHNINNSLLISMCILRELPHQKNPKVLCRGSSPNSICSHIPMEIFIFYGTGKKRGNQKRVTYLRRGYCTRE
jgi:hypothetical protein